MTMNLSPLLDIMLVYFLNELGALMYMPDVLLSLCGADPVWYSYGRVCATLHGVLIVLRLNRADR